MLQPAPVLKSKPSGGPKRRSSTGRAACRPIVAPAACGRAAGYGRERSAALGAGCLRRRRRAAGGAVRQRPGVGVRDPRRAGRGRLRLRLEPSAGADLRGSCCARSGTMEVVGREHFTGYRAHTALLSAIPAIAAELGVVALFGNPSQRGLLLLAVGADLHDLLLRAAAPVRVRPAGAGGEVRAVRRPRRSADLSAGGAGFSASCRRRAARARRARGVRPARRARGARRARLARLARPGRLRGATA